MTTIDAWFKSLPPFTKYYFCASVLTSTVITFKLLSSYLLILDFPSVIHELEIWRPLTCFIFFGGWSISVLISMAIL